MRPSLVTKKSKWAHMSKHEQAWARMLHPLILTGLTSKSPIFGLRISILHHETLYGDKKSKWAHISMHEQAWASMSKTAKSADFNRINSKVPYFGPPHVYLTSLDPIWWWGRASEHTWASLSKNAKFADFNRFNIEVPHLSPPHAFTSWDPIW